VLSHGRCRRQGQRPKITGPQDVADVVRADLKDLPQETMLVLLLNTAHEVLAVVEVALGGIASVNIDPRLVLGAALAAGAPRLIIAHNHPSGSLQPSTDDDELTRRMGRAATEVGLKLLDHVIIGERGQFYSYETAGRLEG